MEVSATSLLQTSLSGDADAARKLFPIVYAELRELAQRLMREQRGDHTLQPTALIHEAWVRLIEPSARGEFENRQHFMQVAVTAMRNILVDHARRRGALKRGGDREKLAIDELVEPGEAQDEQVLAVDGAMAKLTREDPELARLVELRFFGGFSVEQTAEMLDLSTPTVVRRWRVARAWLARELGG
jgi:RNA polymerase sigma factor (TIGR02999 family)